MSTHHLFHSEASWNLTAPVLCRQRGAIMNWSWWGVWSNLTQWSEFSNVSKTPTVRQMWMCSFGHDLIETQVCIKVSEIDSSKIMKQMHKQLFNLSNDTQWLLLFDENQVKSCCHLFFAWVGVSLNSSSCGFHSTWHKNKNLDPFLCVWWCKTSMSKWKKTSDAHWAFFTHKWINLKPEHWVSMTFKTKILEKWLPSLFDAKNFALLLKSEFFSS